MGNIHTPKTIYKDSFALEFFVHHKEVYYKLSKWDKEGSSLSLLDSAKLGVQKPEDILEKASRLFTDVGVNQ